MGDVWLDLVPKDPFVQVDLNLLVPGLIRAGFITGARLEDKFTRGTGYLAGPQFLSYFEIKQMPQYLRWVAPNYPMLSVEIVQTYPAWKWHFSFASDRVTPACEACQGKVAECLADIFASWHDAEDKAAHRYECVHCGQLQSLWDLDWDHRAGVSRTHLHLFSCTSDMVHKQDLCGLLAEVSHTEWTYIDGWT
ncbi:MAG: hypothetical protein AAF125_01705 [Chloroflexota bacterium]